MSCKENNDKSKNCQDGECIFPFIPHRTYCDVKNKEPVDHCVPHKKNGKAICATEVNKGVMKKYGYCGDKKIKSISDEDIPPKKSRKELSEKIEKLEVGKIDDKSDTKNIVEHFTITTSPKGLNMNDSYTIVREPLDLTEYKISDNLINDFYNFEVM